MGFAKIYHAICLAKVCGYRGRSVQYFAFGANLDPKVLEKRNIATRVPHQKLW